MEGAGKMRVGLAFCFQALPWNLNLGGYSFPNHFSSPFCYLPYGVLCIVGCSLSSHLLRREMGKWPCLGTDSKTSTDGGGQGHG